MEFYNSGQEGFTNDWDPRFSLALVNTGTVSDQRPSSVIGCAFHDGLASAIGLFGANGLQIEDNVIHHTVRSGMGHSFVIFLCFFVHTYINISFNLNTVNPH